ncbi:hypothetical protein K7432_014091 [Basidiobolus ranarum]|uniref:Aminoglycoside phosphotransferase domain-containing protein n=1 Tax=Basidiobolus ranarum TaxID=34480 RepID=A0ABR2VPY5_9FUNG
MNDTLILIPNELDLITARELYHETSGPRTGITLSFDDADRLIAHHVEKKLDQLFYFKRGYNNRVYMARCTDGSEYIIRLSGKFWDHKKITNETMAIQLAKTVLEDIVQLPEVIGVSECTSQSIAHTKIIPQDYIIMTRLSGVPMDSVWDELSLDDKRIIVRQVAQIFAALRSIKLTTIGNFIKGKDGQPEVGEFMESGMPAFGTWRDFTASNMENEIKLLRQNANNFYEILENLTRLEFLVEKIRSGELEQKFNSADVDEAKERPISFLHGDFESRNMLVIGTHITGLHDFEFAGAFPSENEWCAGFEWLFARSEDPFDEKEQTKVKNLTESQAELRNLLFAELKRNGIPIDNNHIWKTMLYHAQANIAPWWLRENPRENWTEQDERSYTTAVASLTKTLEFFGL